MKDDCVRDCCVSIIIHVASHNMLKISTKNECNKHVLKVPVERGRQGRGSDHAREAFRGATVL